MPWFAVRCVFASRDDASEATLYEERVTLWCAGDADDAIRQAETDAHQYATDTDSEYLEFAQSFRLDEAPGSGAEVFSLFRASELEASAYLDRFFDTGEERQSR